MGFRTLLAVPLLAPSTLAQAGGTVTVVGVVQPVGGPTICMQGETHYLECTQVFLKSSVVNLGSYAGQTVRVSGVDVGVTCHVIEVAQASPAGVRLSWSGSPTPGGTVTFMTCVYLPNPPHPYWLFFSAGAGYFPIDPSFGTVLLASPFFFLGSGFAAICGNLAVAIPPDPGLLGATFWEEAFTPVLPFLGPPLSNATCLTIL